MNTMYDLIAELEKQVPEIKGKHEEVFALIKQHVHDEKYHVWFMLNLHFFRDKYGRWYRSNKFIDRVMAYFGWIRQKPVESYIKSIEEHALIKMETHSSENWGNYDQCLDWVKKYSPKSKG